MMKKINVGVIIAILAMIYSFSIIVSAEPCNIQISMINQDPYPAIQGDYVKVLFKIDGIRNTECGTVTFGVKEDYPVSLDPNVENPITIKSGIYEKDYNSYYLAPYKLRIDSNALDGDNPIETYYSTKTASNVVKEFDITVEDIRADFEVHVKDYNYATRKLTFEILNIAKSDVELLRIEIPKQENINVKGTNKIVVGDLDSNEYTTADFEAILPKGETKINLNIIYEDAIGESRELQKVVDFDSSYFVDRNGDKKSQPYWLYILILLGIIIFVWRRRKKKKREEERRKRKAMA